MEGGKTDNERELTSTMGNVLSVSIKDEKNDTSGSDATPTSSTDANTSTTSSRIVSDDPISSTSSDVVELNKSKNLEVSIQSSTETSETAMDEPDKSSVDPENDLLEMSISSVSRERITEDVEDLVHDLESLLGESTDSFNIPIKRREDQKSPTVKESAKASQIPSESGDTFSAEDNASDKKIESAQDDDTKEDIIIETSNLSLQEEAEEEESKDEPIVCNINEIETKEETNESSEPERESPLEISFEPETSLVSENVIEEISHEIKIDEPEIVCETEDVETLEVSASDKSVITHEVEEKVEESIKDIIAGTNEEPEHEESIEQSTEETVIEKTDVEDSTSESKPSDQLPDEKESESQECKASDQDKEQSEGLTVEKEDGQSEVVLVASSTDSNIQEDGSEKTEEADICHEESISRDIKTDIVESVDKEPQSSTTKEPETCSVDEDSPGIDNDAQKDKNKESDVENVLYDIPEEVNEVEEINSESNGDAEVTDDSAATQLISENSNHDQEEQADVVPVQEVVTVKTNASEEVDHSPPTVITLDSQELVSEEVEENFELVLTENTESHQTDIPTEMEQVSEVIVVKETENQPSDQPGREHSEPDLPSLKADETAQNSEVMGSVNTEEITTILDSGSAQVLKESEVSKVQEPQENIPKTQNEDTDSEGVSVVIEEAVDNTEDVTTVIEEAADNTENISTVIEKIVDNTEDVTTVIGEAGDNTEDVSTVIEETVDKTEDISTVIEETVDDTDVSTVIEEIVDKTEDVSTVLEETVDKEDVCTVIEEIVDNTEDVTNRTEECVNNTEDVSPVIEEIVDDTEIKESVILPADNTIEPPIEADVIETTSFTEIIMDTNETIVISETNSESNQIETTRTDVMIVETHNEDNKSEVQTTIEQTVVTEISELICEGELTSNSSSTCVTHVEVTEVNKASNIDINETPSPVTITDITENLVPEVDTDKNEAEIAECEESIPEQVPEISEDVEKDIQPLIEDLVSDKIPVPQQKVLLDPEEIEEPEIAVAKPDETTNDLNDANLVEEEPREQETSQEIVPVEDSSNEADEITKFSTAISEISNEIIETGDTALAEVADNSRFGPDASELEEVSTGDSRQEHVLQWVEDLAPIENEEAGSNSEVVDDDGAETISGNKIVEIMDEDSKIMEPEPETVAFFSAQVDSDSEDTVPTLVLEPDEVLPSPEPVGLEKEIDEPSCLTVDSTNDDPDKLPEIEEILNDEGNVDDVVENIDMQENLETILAVASLQDVTIADVPVVEPQMSDKERREMEALRMAVESITDTSDSVYDDVEPITELVASVEQSINQIPSGIEVVDDSIEEAKSTANLQPNEAEESIISKDVSDLEENQVQSSIEANDIVCVNKAKFVEDAATKENHLKEVSIAENALPDTSEDKINMSNMIRDIIGVLPDSSQGILVCDEVKLAESAREKEGKVKVYERSKRHKKSTSDNKFEELSINVDVPEREKPYSPKVTIKPIKVPDEEVSTTSNSDTEVGKGSLKMTITKQFDKMHSVLKICDSDNSDPVQEPDEPIPKLIIKPKMQQVEQQHSPKMSTRSSKQMYSPTSSSQRSGSPRVTIKPVVKPDKVESVTPLKIKIKPDEGSKRHSPKLNIKPMTKPEEDGRENIQSPRKVTIKPIKTPEELEQIHSPRITIKPIPKPDLEKESISITPRLSIKPIKRDDEEVDVDRERSSPKITIKPVKPPEPDTQATEPDDAVKERIVLKINKGNLPPTPTKDAKKREHPPDDEKSEKLAKITVKFSKGGGHPHIVHQNEDSNKRPHDEQSPEKMKKMKVDNESPSFIRSKHKDTSEIDTSKMKQKEIESHPAEARSKHSHPVCDSPVEAKRVKLKDTPESSKQKDSINEAQKPKTNNDYSDDVRIIETKLDSPIVISEDSRSQDSGSCVIIEDRKDPLTSTPLYDISMKATPETPQAVPMKQDSLSCTPTIPVTPTPRKRGRPRKVPIVVREDFKEQEEPKKEQPPQLLHESGRPKRSCRGQSVRATLGIKPRKPRGPGRGRGGKRGMGTRVVPMKPEGLSK